MTWAHVVFYGSAVVLGAALNPLKFKRYLIAASALIAMLAVTPQVAEAHTITKAQCRTYAAARAVIVNPTRPGSRRRAFRVCRRQAKKHWLTHGLPIPHLLSLIRACESGRRIDGRGIAGTFSYTAQNPTSTASGAYGYLDSTWAGHRGYLKARLAPRRYQDARALRDFNISTSPWASSSTCWGPRAV